MGPGVENERTTKPERAASALDDGLGRTVVVADGILSAWLEPMPKGLRSEELRPFLCAMTSRPGQGTSVPAMLEELLLALNGRDVRITIEVRPNVELRRGRDDATTESGGCCPSPRTEG